MIGLEITVNCKYLYKSPGYKAVYRWKKIHKEETKISLLSSRNNQITF